MLSSHQHVYLSGVARGGTSLVGRMLDARSDTVIGIDAFLHVFRFMRNEILKGETGFNPSLPFEDGAFDFQQRDRLLKLHSFKGGLSTQDVDLNLLSQMFRDRASDESFDLVGLSGEIPSKETFADLFAACFAQMQNIRSKQDARYVGVKDLWIIDLFPALARWFDGSKFIIIFRDPRAVINSVLGYLAIDPTQCGHVLSFLRHWRKLNACCLLFQKMELFSDRLMTIRYEDVVLQPETSAECLSTFLNLPYEEAMINLGGFKDFTKGGRWKGNSTFSELDTISAKPVNLWQEKLSEEMIQFVEYILYEDMLLQGYTPHYSLDELERNIGSHLSAMLQEEQRHCSWRSDFGDSKKDFGYESWRRAMLKVNPEFLSSRDIEDAFLFNDYYHALRRMRD